MAPILDMRSLFVTFVILNICSQLVHGQTVDGAHPPVIGKFGGPVDKNHQLLLLEGPANRFNLNCHVKAVPEAEILWYKDDSLIDGSSFEGIRLTPSHTETLEFTDPKVDVHQGYYHCEASNEMGRARSEVIHVTATNKTYDPRMSPPNLTTEPEMEIKEVENQAIFKCEADGIPHPKIFWYKNGEILEDYTDKDTLIIPSITPSDIGTFACNASNQVGYDYKLVYLNILTTSPFFMEKPRNRTVSIGQASILRCGVKGYPKPEIEWFFEKEPILNDSTLYEISSQGDLTIKKINAGHQGGFECRATNSHGNRSAIANLKVVSTTTIDNGPVDTKAQVKSSVRMNCSVLWDPTFELEIMWRKDNLDVHIDGKRISLDVHEHFLTINDLSFGDSGTYTCVARTQAGTATDSGTLTVTGIPPTLIAGPTQMTIPEGADIIALCSVTGLPLPRHTWFKNVNRVNYNDRVKMNKTTGTLTIKNANMDDSAKYLCKAENGYEPYVSASAFIDVRKRSRVIKAPDHALLKPGKDVRFDCLVQVDPQLRESLRVDWYKNEERLDVDSLPLDNETLATEVNESRGRFLLMPNATLHIKAPTPEDLGTYRCLIQTGIDKVILEAVLYSEEDWNWLLILIAIIVCILILILCILCIVCVRKRSRRKGKYGVDDVGNGKKSNRSDIQYSIDDDTESLHKDLDPELASRTPIYNPKKGGGKRPIDNGDMKGSENSLLNMTDEDIWLRKGMDEDGSFRKVYMGDE